MRNDRWDAVVRSKGHAFAILVGIKTESAVLVMRGMEVPTAQKWPHFQFKIAGVTAAGYKAPRNKNRRFALRNKQLLLNEKVVFDLVTPARPRLVFEGFNARCAVRVDHIGSVALR